MPGNLIVGETFNLKHFQWRVGGRKDPRRGGWLSALHTLRVLTPVGEISLGMHKKGDVWLVGIYCIISVALDS